MLNQLIQAHIVALALITSLSMIGCVGGGGGSDNSTTDSSSSSQPAQTTPWSPSASTTGVPTFGKNCRYAAESVFSAPSNQMLDDTVKFTVTSTGASLSLNVRNNDQSILTANDIQLEQGLKDKSYRKASGTATWSSAQKIGSIVDGTFCLSSKLATGTNLEAEFSLVMKLADGSHESISGSFLIPAEAISDSPDLSVESQALDIGL